MGASTGCQVLVKGFCSVALTHRALPTGQGLWSAPLPTDLEHWQAGAPAKSWYNHDTLAGFSLDCNQHALAKVLNHSAPQSGKAHK